MTRLATCGTRRNLRYSSRCRWRSTRWGDWTLLHLGARPSILAEPGSQRSDRSWRHSSRETPLLVVPSLRGDDCVDGTTVTYHLKMALGEKEEKEVSRPGVAFGAALPRRSAGSPSSAGFSGVLFVMEEEEEEGAEILLSFLRVFQRSSHLEI